MVVMRRALAHGARPAAGGGGDHGLPEVPYEELNRNYVSAAARNLISEQQLAVLQASSPLTLALFSSHCIAGALVHRWAHWAMQRTAVVSVASCPAYP